jgi:hypothetical protein
MNEGNTVSRSNYSASTLRRLAERFIGQFRRLGIISGIASGCCRIHRALLTFSDEPHSGLKERRKKFPTANEVIASSRKSYTELSGCPSFGKT